MPPACITVMLSELAAGSRSVGSSLGSTADRVGWLTAKNACCTANSASSSQTSSAPSAACSQNPALVQDQPAGGDDQQRAAVEDVGQRAAPQPEDHQRHQAEHARQPDVRRGAGHRVDLRRDRDHRQLRADDGDDVGPPQPAEVVVAERAGVRQQPVERHPTTLVAARNHRARRLSLEPQPRARRLRCERASLETPAPGG